MFVSRPKRGPRTIASPFGRWVLVSSLAALPALGALPPAPGGLPQWVGTVERLAPGLDAIVAPGTRPELLATGLEWAEGPAWRKAGQYLLFSDVRRNTIYRWTESGGLRVFLRPAGFTEAHPYGRSLGSNGLTFDPEGRLVMLDHGNRRVVRLDETNYTKVVLADRYLGRRFNSPNDLAYRSNGDLYFTDPPYGLKGLNEDPHRELSFNGVYRLDPRGGLSLLTGALTFPNGLAFSPDQNTLYVVVSDPARAVLMAFRVQGDGSLDQGRVFFDATGLLRSGLKGLPDGMKVDVHGNIFLGGPGGLLVISPAGIHLGTIVTGKVTANCAFGDDGSTLYLTAADSLMRIRLRTKGLGF